MTTFQLNIAVNIGVTDELKQLLTSIFATSCYAPTPIAEDPQPADNVATSAANVETSAANVATSAEEAAPEQPTEKIYTEVDVRDAMDRARRRIEGEDYKTNTTGELYTQWHRKLTAWFKQTAAAYGSDKPSTLPDSESRRKFIEECDLVHVSGSCLTVPLPY
jgi:hypothetical protein